MTRGQLKAQMRFVQLKRLKRLQTGFVVAAVIFVAEVALSAVAVAKADDPGHHCRGRRVACIVPDSQPARLSLQLTGKPLLQRKSEKHKNVATGLASMLQVALQLCTNNHLAGQNLNKPQNHIYY